LERRPFLLSNVILRQNPHNVNEWLNRVTLCQSELEATLATYTEALKTVDATKSVGKASKLWIQFALFYEEFDEIENANVVFYKAS
jgi:pre-mRNA-splicing factor SYF1